MHVTIRRGLDLPLLGAPQQHIHGAKPVGSVALLGADYVGLKPSMAVQEGDRVALGETLFVDKRSPEVRYTAPGAGIVREIRRGMRRALQAVIVGLDGEDEVHFSAYAPEALASLTRDQAVGNLTASGLWTALRTRPYGKVPDPASEPAALFVNAMDTNPLAARPAVVLAETGEDFASGIAVLARLTPGRVFVCSDPETTPPLPAAENVVRATFAGPHPAGLVGTHIHFIAPVGAQRTVWHLDYQDVIAVGRLFTTGRLVPERIVALGGPTVMNPRLLRTRLGASVRELTAGELDAVECRVLSGSALSGRRATDWAAYLGRYHSQITVLREGRERELFGWLSPGMRKFSATRVLLSNLLRPKSFRLTTSQNGSPRAMVPIGAYERVMPLDILATPLLRALLVHDTDRAQALGALELEEEDLALLSFVCPSKHDFGPVLRANLELIEREG
jgi:Na+-transporting NADH:ubiquinone oxidoreductase subunit A